MKYELPADIVRLEHIISEASKISVSDIRGPGRRADVVRARHAVWCLSVRFMRYRCIDVARMYGRDHTSILHAIERFGNSDYEKVIKAGVEYVWQEAWSEDVRRRARQYRDLNAGWRFKATKEKAA